MEIINLDKIRKISLTGVSRAAAFMGFGINAANSDSLNQYQLNEYPQIRLLPDRLDDEQMKNMKVEFRKWITVNAFRELIETYFIFLDNIYQACLTMAISMKKTKVNEHKDLNNKFVGAGLKQKFKLLKDNFSIISAYHNYLISINKARNCMTHRKGIVGQKDTDKNGKLTVKWIGYDCVESPDDGISKKITVHKVPRNKSFSQNEEITFTARELNEICDIVKQATIDIYSKTILYSKKIGIPVQ